MKMEAFEKMSVTVKIVLYELEVGSLTMKSMAMYVNGKVNDSDEMG